MTLFFYNGIWLLLFVTNFPYDHCAYVDINYVHIFYGIILDQTTWGDLLTSAKYLHV